MVDDFSKIWEFVIGLPLWALVIISLLSFLYFYKFDNIKKFQSLLKVGIIRDIMAVFFLASSVGVLYILYVRACKVYEDGIGSIILSLFTSLDGWLYSSTLLLNSYTVLMAVISLIKILYRSDNKNIIQDIKSNTSEDNYSHNEDDDLLKERYEVLNNLSDARKNIIKEIALSNTGECVYPNNNSDIRYLCRHDIIRTVNPFNRIPLLNNFSRETCDYGLKYKLSDWMLDLLENNAAK